MADLNTDVRYIKGIGEQRAKALGKLGIATLRDLISYFPRAYDDRSALRRIADLVPGETAGVAAMVASPPTISHIRKGLDLVKLRAVDDTGTLDVTFFNQAWLKNSLHQGETYIFYGRAEGSLLRHQMANPVVEPEGRREYARMLTELAAGRHLWGSVSAFGECDAAIRIRRAAAWRPKPEWRRGLSLILSLLLILFLFTGGWAG